MYSFIQVVDFSCQPWQAETLINMSKAFCAEYNQTSQAEASLQPMDRDDRSKLHQSGAAATKALLRGFRSMDPVRIKSRRTGAGVKEEEDD